jgi:S1-C subfamily serine protease
MDLRKSEVCSGRTLALVAGAVALTVAGCAAPSASSRQTPSTTTPTPVREIPFAGQSSTPAPTNALATLQQEFVSVVAQTRPSVVEVSTNSDLGSGIVFDDHGDIVTNDHVVGSQTAFQVQTVSGRTVPASLVGAYPQGDLAVIRASAPLGVPPATFGTSATLAPGSIVFAIGSPLGLNSSVTEGLVSYNGRPFSEGNGVNLPATIQTTAAINPGNSGGALVDLTGQVIGIPTLTVLNPEDHSQAEGLGFAIPSDEVVPIVRQLIVAGRVANSGQASLEIQGSDAVDGSGEPIGVVVGRVPPGSGVAKAGVAVGDVVTAVNGQPTPTVAELADVLAGLHSGEVVSAALVLPDGTHEVVRVVLGQLT